MEIIKGAVAIIYRQIDSSKKQYLLLQHKNTLWTFVGGKIEDTDNSVEEGIQREIMEELGLEATDYELKDTGILNEFIYGDEKPDRAGKKGVTYYYEGKLFENAEPKCSAEIINLKWLNKEEVLNHLAFDDIKTKFLEVINN